MLRYYFQGYADVLNMATTLRPPPQKPAPKDKALSSEQAGMTVTTRAWRMKRHIRKRLPE